MQHFVEMICFYSYIISQITHFASRLCLIFAQRTSNAKDKMEKEHLAQVPLKKLQSVSHFTYHTATFKFSSNFCFTELLIYQIA